MPEVWRVDAWQYSVAGSGEDEELQVSVRKFVPWWVVVTVFIISLPVRLAAYVVQRHQERNLPHRRSGRTSTSGNVNNRAHRTGGSRP